MKTTSHDFLPLTLPLLLLLAGCGDLAGPAPTQVMSSGEAPALSSWSGSSACCGEDPHPVHAAVLEDGSVAMVGKAGAGGLQTAGFLTRWAAPDGPATGRLVDEGEAVIQQTLLLAGDSALLQVAEVDGVLVAVGFEAASETAPARGLALALDPVDLRVLARLVLTPEDPSRSAALESIAHRGEGGLLLGGSWDLARDQMEGFKSYGNVVGGSGVLLALELGPWLAASSEGAAVTPAEAGAEVHAVPEVMSLKSLRVASGGSLLSVGSNEEEQSGVVLLEADLSRHDWVAYQEGIELTDVAAVEGEEGPAIAVVGHGGDGTIDGHVGLLDEAGEVLWSTSFGNPGVDASEQPEAGLAPDAFIFDECWGIAVQGDQLIAACGTGIEGCGAVPAPPAETALCRTDPRRAWRSYLVGLSPAGEVLWSRAESFVDEGGEGAESAAEFVVTDGPETLYGIIDQSFGVGLARYTR